MISGQVTTDREAVISLPIRRADGLFQVVEAIIDTGFTEYLTLPSNWITSLNLPLLNATAMSVAGGSVINVNVYEAVVTWEGQIRTIKVHSAEGDPLVGMSLLYGFRLTMDVVDGGSVTIEHLP